jgi:2-oxoisovalerate dehydrogenase E1 component
MVFDRKNYSDKKLLEIYKAILKPRLIEERMLLLLRQNKISKWFSGMGQEAIPVGATLAFKDDEFILPMHRNLGVFTTRNVPLEKLFAQFKGKKSGFTKGRDRSFHFGAPEYKLVGMISHLGPQLGVADGIALAELLEGTNKVTLVYSGDGGSSEGDFHEALNVAAVWNLPVIFMIESNGYGLSTPSSQQFKFDSFTQKGPGYGMEAISIDGNNVLEVYTEMTRLASSIRKKPRPVLVEARTFRMRGHEEASGTKYVPPELMDQWARKDPVENYEKFLVREKVLNDKIKEAYTEEIKAEIEAALKMAWAEDLPVADTREELQDVYAPYTYEEIAPTGSKKSKKRLVDAFSDGLRQALQRHQKTIFMGQDVADYGGVFKVSEGFLEEFGEARIRNTPLCESAIFGAALGLSVQGYKSVVEMQFADFITSGFNQVVNNLAKLYYRWGQNVDVVIRMPTGAGVAAGPFHSQSNEAWFFHTPGIKIFYPSNPYDAKGLMAAAIEDPNPVMIFEHKALYRAIADKIPDDYYTVAPGVGRIVKEGSDLSIVTYGMGVHWAQQASNELPEIDLEIIDLRTLIPWDQEIVRQSLNKTGKLLVLHEDTLTGGIGGEISAWVAEHCFTLLDAPVVRVASLDTPVPFTSTLENNFLAKSRLLEKLKELADF